MKEHTGTLDATPSKRVFLSIIADYTLREAICELIDNAHDAWTTRGRIQPLSVNILINLVQQTITIEDNAGGIPKAELSKIITPGGSSSTGEEFIIGMFGVGGKRAVVALSQDIEIVSRYARERTYAVDIDEAWLRDEQKWDLPFYETDSITPGTTSILLKKIRFGLDQLKVDELEEHLSAVYGLLLDKKLFTVTLQGNPIKPQRFDRWSYPPEYPPSRAKDFTFDVQGDQVTFSGVAGLINGHGSIAGEYGVYFYCNNRLIDRARKTYHCGFKGPHHSISIVRVLVFLNGPARAMPWNSSKSGINTEHPAFLALRKWLGSNVEYYSKVSRALVQDWQEKVFPHSQGKVIEYPIEQLETVPVYYRLAPPKMRLRYRTVVEELNKKTALRHPWAKGHYEAIIAVDILFRDKQMEQKNRLCLLILDSTLEIAFKDYLLNEPKHQIGPNDLRNNFGTRNKLHQKIQSCGVVPKKVWPIIAANYQLRCQLMHERSAARIADDEIRTFQQVVQLCLTKMFGLSWPTDE